LSDGCRRNIQAAKLSFVPAILRIKLFPISFSMWDIAFRPVQCVGMM